MAYRPSWQGHLKLSLVTCPVGLYTATNSGGDVHFHLINPATNNRTAQKAEIEVEIGFVTGDGNPLDAWGSGTFAANLPLALKLFDANHRNTQCRLQAVVRASPASSSGAGCGAALPLARKLCLEQRPNRPYSRRKSERSP